MSTNAVGIGYMTNPNIYINTSIQVSNTFGLKIPLMEPDPFKEIFKYIILVFRLKIFFIEHLLTMSD